MTEIPEKPGPSLRDYPEIAVEIACFIGNFNAVEAMLHLAFAQMIQDSVGFSHAVLAPWNSFAAKFKIILDVAHLCSDTPHAKAILSLEQDIRNLNTFRNLLAHSAYSIEDGKVSALSYLVSSRNPKSAPLSMTLIDEHRAVLKRVHSGLAAAISPSTGEDRNTYRRPAK